MDTGRHKAPASVLREEHDSGPVISNHPGGAHREEGPVTTRASDPSPPSVPETLGRFVPHEWPGEADPLRAWCRARLDFVAEYPDTPLGSPVDVCREHYRIKRGRAGDR